MYIYTILNKSQPLKKLFLFSRSVRATHLESRDPANSRSCLPVVNLGKMAVFWEFWSLKPVPGKRTCCFRKKSVVQPAEIRHFYRRLFRSAPGAFTSSPHLVGQAEILYHMGEFRSLKLLKTHAQQDPGNQQPTSCAADLGTILYEGVSEFELVSHSHRAPWASGPGKVIHRLCTKY